MLNSRLLITLATAAVLAGGCATSPAASSGGSRYVITETELANVREQSAYEALQASRCYGRFVRIR